MKGKLLIIAIMVIISTCIAANTGALITKEAIADNVITMGNIDLELIETTEDKLEFLESGVVVLPGATVSKIVSVKNTSNHPMFVRLQLSKFVSNSDLQEHFMENGILTTDFNDTDWTIGKDGFIYYNNILKPGAETEPVLTEVYIDGPNTDNQYLGAEFTLQVDAYGVQSENNGEKYSDAAGWPAVSSDNSKSVFVPQVD